MRTIGFNAENRATRYLIRRGWRVIARNWRVAGGELDIIALRRGTVAFVEVKARANAAELVEPISYRQRERIVRTAQLFLARRNDLSGYEVRVDLLAIHLTDWPISRIRHHRGVIDFDDYATSSNRVRWV